MGKWYKHCISESIYHCLTLTSQGLRGQIDRDQYRTNMQEEIKKYPSLTVCEDSVEDVLMCTREGDQHPKINGVILGMELIQCTNMTNYNLTICRIW